MVTLKELLIKPPPANPKKVKISKNPHQRSYYNQNKAIINKLACVLKKKQYQSILKNKYELIKTRKSSILSSDFHLFFCVIFFLCFFFFS